MKLFMNFIGLFMAKPSKCPQCGNEYFSWDREERGGVIWKCNKCGREIKD
jgi:ribosomal protein L37AE/L43A